MTQSDCTAIAIRAHDMARAAIVWSSGLALVAAGSWYPFLG
ncbi:hypothetical protein [Parerythrobacter jejuensis]|nr:hypothetical protein [Parerythrobacter jejuensis]